MRNLHGESSRDDHLARAARHPSRGVANPGSLHIAIAGVAVLASGGYTLRMRLVPCLLVAMLLPSAPGFASPRIVIPEQLRQSALVCLGEVLRLCPDALAAKDHGISCILGKRRRLSVPCRSVYDQGVRLLNGGDIHLTLRRPKPR